MRDTAAFCVTRSAPKPIVFRKSFDVVEITPIAGIVLGVVLKQQRLATRADQAACHRAPTPRARHDLGTFRLEAHSFSPVRLARAWDTTGNSRASDSAAPPAGYRWPSQTPLGFASIDDDFCAALAVDLPAHTQAGKVFERSAAHRTVGGVGTFWNDGDGNVHLR
jgi:hypothetical protein